jgi:hypothetical protein
MAQAKGVFMTTLVNEVIAAYLAQQPDADVTFATQSRPRAASCGPQRSGARSAIADRHGAGTHAPT